MEIVVASRNPAKVREVRRALGGLARAVGMHDLVPELAGDDVEGDADDESGGRGNVETIARRKAIAASRAVGGGRVVVATDGGLLVPGLGDRWDPTRTRRFAGAGASASERAAALLALTAGLTGDERRISWVEAMAVARDGEVLAAWTATGPPGLLSRDVDPAPLPADGFWVPSLWCCPEFGGRRLSTLTLAEQAARHDHWARLGPALRQLVTSRRFT